jgi:hypothetical protein
LRDFSSVCRTALPAHHAFPEQVRFRKHPFHFGKALPETARPADLMEFGGVLVYLFRDENSRDAFA